MDKNLPLTSLTTSIKSPLFCFVSSVLISTYLFIYHENAFFRFFGDYYSESSKDKPDRSHLNNYALDYHKAINLSKLELNLSSLLGDLMTQFDTKPDKSPEDVICQHQIKIYLEEHGKDLGYLKLGSNSSLPLNNIPDNPLLLFRMIRRIVVTLLEDVSKQCVHVKTVNDTVTSVFNSSELKLPNKQDLDDALLGILRLQYFYIFNASQLRLGIFEDVHTNVKLNFDDCLALANYAMDRGPNKLAYQWLVSANFTSQEENEELKVSWTRLLKVSGHASMNEMNLAFQNAKEENWTDTSDELYFYSIDEYAICRSESKLTEEEKSELFCKLDTTRHPYFTVNPLKVEFLHLDPTVFQIHDFIGNKMMNYLKKNATASGFDRSVVASYENRSAVSNDRTSLTSWLDDIYEEGLDNNTLDLGVVALLRRVEFLSGFFTLKTTSSDSMQIAAYSSLGAHYDFHNDAFDDITLLKTHQNGNRIATFFMFLSDVAMGGNTAFNKLGIFVKPKKGSAIFWMNLYRNGEVDRRMAHGGCPVVFGYKLVANKWIRYNENFRRFPCTLDPLD